MYDKAIVREHEGMERKRRRQTGGKENQEREEGRDAVAQWVLL